MYLPRDISYYIVSLGCSKNLVDSESINGELYSNGFKPADDAEYSDIVIINTCGFIDDAKKESIDVIFEALESREGHLTPGCDAEPAVRGPFGKKIVVTGCLSQRYKKELKEEIPEIDFIYGIPDVNFVRDLCSAFGISTPVYYGKKKVLSPGLPYRYIKISEGCSNRCSYCAIPIIRGDRTSFPADAIVRDVESAVTDGAKEIILVSQDTASYNYKGTGLRELVNVVSKVGNIEWIRLMYCHPDHITDDLIALFVENDMLVKYIDIPFQHASENILRRMGRRGNAGKYLSLLDRLRSNVPDIRIRSTFMAGFPGESEKDFTDLMDFLIKADIDRAGCFAYSREENTPAAELPDQVPETEKKNRYNRLMKRQKEISKAKMKKSIGSVMRVLVEEQVDEETFIGRSEFDAPEVDGIFYLTGSEIAVNSIIRSRVTDSLEYDLIGVPV